MGATVSQLWPPAPKFTGKDVFIVPGASAGVGKELARILYLRNGKVYLASRTESRASAAISQIRSAVPQSKGDLHFLSVDLEDLSNVKAAAAAFLKREGRLDALWNNAGVMLPPVGSKTKQGYELQLGTNCLASFLFTQLLTPLLVETARGQEPGTVRVMWVASSAAEFGSPPNGVDMDNLDYNNDIPNFQKYGTGKAGMVLLSQEYAKLHKEDGIISVAMNPGNLKTDLRRQLSWPVATVFGWISWDPVYGAFTELFAAFSGDITVERSGCWVLPWGRVALVRQGIRDAAKAECEGGSGVGGKFWAWCTEQVETYMYFS